MANPLIRDWEVVRSWLPEGWEEAARRLGAFERGRKIKTPERLLMLLLGRFCGWSLRATAAHSGTSEAERLSDVAVLGRQRKANVWLEWLLAGLLVGSRIRLRKPDRLAHRRIRAVDATVIVDRTRAHRKWRIHYGYDLFDMRCSYLRLTGEEVGETLKHFPIQPGDLILGDRLYASLSGMWYVKQQGGDFILRVRNKAFKYYPAAHSGEINLLQRLRRMKPQQAREWTLRVQTRDQAPMLVRVIAFRLPDQEAAKAIVRAEDEARKAGRALDPETRELQRYTILVTSVMKEELGTSQILQLYRARWQIEIAFKRLKSLMGIGKLPCRTSESSSSWLLGKMLIALLVQRLIDEGRYASLSEMGLINEESDASGIAWEGNIWREVQFAYGLLKHVIEWHMTLVDYLIHWKSMIDALGERIRRRRRQIQTLIVCLS